MDNKNTVFYNLIQKNYNEIKKRFTTSLKNCGFDLDEDILHDTLIKCAKKLDNHEVNMSDEEMLNYVYISLKTNMIRDKYYDYNRKTIILDEAMEYSVSNTYINDNKEIYSAVENYVIKNYDEDSFEWFCEWVIDNKSIKFLEKIHGITGLNYKLNKIKRDINNKFGKNFLTSGL